MKRTWPLLLILTAAFAQQGDLLKDLRFRLIGPFQGWALRCRFGSRFRPEDVLLWFGGRWSLEDQ